MKHVFTSESVTQGHPDKICDQIADSILDAALAQDPESKMAVEATIKDELIFVYGEANTKADLDYAQIAKEVVRKIGFEEEYQVLVKVGVQSAEIFQAVAKEEVHAGDQGIMFGYACEETKTYMPLSIHLAHLLAKQLTKVFQEDPATILKPDGKTQVSVEYEGDTIARIDTILVSTQHCAGISQHDLETYVMKHVILPVVKDYPVDADTKYIINPSGSFVVGGSFGDSGTTGRKIVVDTYGGHGRIGGGCFSSKDGSKVDRTAAYYARFVAKNIVANGFAKKCEVELSYAIGQSKPISVFIDTFGTNAVSEEQIHALVEQNFDFRVAHMIEAMQMKRPMFAPLAAYGHFGREDLNLPWEQIISLKA